MSTLETIKEQIESNAILLYMKGTPRFPQCGFSSRSSEALMSCNERFAFVNILENPDIRAELPYPRSSSSSGAPLAKPHGLRGLRFT